MAQIKGHGDRNFLWIYGYIVYSYSFVFSDLKNFEPETEIQFFSDLRNFEPGQPKIQVLLGFQQNFACSTPRDLFHSIGNGPDFSLAPPSLPLFSIWNGPDILIFFARKIQMFPDLKSSELRKTYIFFGFKKL